MTEAETIADLQRQILLLEGDLTTAKHDQARAEQHVAEVRGGLDKTMYDYERQSAVDLRRSLDIIGDLTNLLMSESGGYR